MSGFEPFASSFSHIPFLSMFLSTHFTVLRCFILNPSLLQGRPPTPPSRQRGSCSPHKQTISPPPEVSWLLLPSLADTAHHYQCVLFTQPDRKAFEARSMFYKHFTVLISASFHLSPLSNSARAPGSD